MDLWSFGTYIILIGFILVFIGFLLLLLDKIQGSSREETQVGGLILIGPIPIVFGDFPLWLAVLLSAIVVILYILYFISSLKGGPGGI